jgi:hypothetical protein
MQCSLRRSTAREPPRVTLIGLKTVEGSTDCRPGGSLRSMSMRPLLAERHLRDGQLHPLATALSAHSPLGRRRRLLAPIRPRRGLVQSDSNRFRAGDVGVELHQRTAACAHMPVDNSPSCLL